MLAPLAERRAPFGEYIRVSGPDALPFLRRLARYSHFPGPLTVRQSYSHQREVFESAAARGHQWTGLAYVVRFTYTERNRGNSGLSSGGEPYWANVCRPSLARYPKKMASLTPPDGSKCVATRNARRAYRSLTWATIDSAYGGAGTQ